MSGSPTVELYYDPFDHAIDDDPYSVWKRMRAEAPLYFNDKYNFYALSRYDDVARSTAGLADVSVGTRNHRRHSVQRHRSTAGDPAVGRSTPARPSPAPVIARLHATSHAGGRGSGARILRERTGSTS